VWPQVGNPAQLRLLKAAPPSTPRQNAFSLMIEISTWDEISLKNLVTRERVTMTAVTINAASTNKLHKKHGIWKEKNVRTVYLPGLVQNAKKEVH
jgi:hypothetical protein